MPAVTTNIQAMKAVLTKAGWTESARRRFSKPQRGYIEIDGNGWESFTEDGKSVDFGSGAEDLAYHIRTAPKQLPPFDEVHYIHYPPEDQTEPGNYFSVVLFKDGQGVFSQLIDEEELDAVVGADVAMMMRRGEGKEVKQPNVTGETNPYKSLTVHSKDFTDQDKDFLRSMNIKSKLMRKGYTMTNEGYGTNSKCYKCQQPIEEGQLSTWEGGMECHAGGCPRVPQQRLTPAERIQKLPQRGTPKTPAQLGLQPRQQAASKKIAIGLTNQGEQNSVCPKCQQPIAEGQMVNYPNGKETHVQCPPSQGQQPGQQAPGWQSRLNLPPGFKPKQQQPATPGQIPANVGAPRAGSLLEKKADSRFIDDEWRAILENYGFKPEGQPDAEIWWNQDIPVRIKIDTDDKGEAFWVAMQNDGTPLESGQDTHRLESQLASISESIEPKEEINWQGDVPEFSDADKDFMRDFRIKGNRIAKVRTEKTAGRKPNFGFAVPMKAAGAVAFHLAKAGMKDFEVIHYEDDDSSMFAFTNEPEMHLAEEIVRAEFADQIAGHKGMWGMWSPSAKLEEDPSLVRSEQELHKPMASDEKVADDPNSYLRGKKVTGPQAVPSRYEKALEQACAALDILAEIGPSDDIKGCAEISVGDLRQFAQEFAEGRARKFSSEGGKVVYCCVLGHLQMNEPIQKRAMDANLATLIGSWVGAVLVKWLGQEYSKRWGNVAKAAEAKAMSALQKQGVYDLGTLDKYATENGTSQIGAFMRLAGQSLLLAVAMTTGIAGAKILNGDAKAPAAAAPVEQMRITDEVDTLPAQAQQPQQPEADPQTSVNERQQDQEVSPQRQQNYI